MTDKTDFCGMVLARARSFGDTQVLQMCGCIGPQPGFPRCPCQMRGVAERNGRWIQLEVDLGPVSGTPSAISAPAVQG